MIWGFPKIRGPFLGVLIRRVIVCLDVFWPPPMYRISHIPQGVRQVGFVGLIVAAVEGQPTCVPASFGLKLSGNSSAT